VRARTPGGRLATTEDVVDAVKFLFNNKGVNGVNLIVDGGWILQ
jgi:NAD(P)-dependent dehydrogenase (short-subunit alcohol dehydrogenase family)